jgi:hypothetical protein
MKIHWPLVVIDTLILLAFSFGGLKFHYEGSQMLAEVIRVVGPFLFGYGVAGLPLKAYELPRSGGVFLGRSVGGWLLGMGAGFLFRGLQRGALPTPIFMGIALAFTGVLTLLGRGGYWVLRGRRQAS